MSQRSLPIIFSSEVGLRPTITSVLRERELSCAGYCGGSRNVARRLVGRSPIYGETVFKNAGVPCQECRSVRCYLFFQGRSGGARPSQLFCGNGDYHSQGIAAVAAISRAV